MEQALPFRTRVALCMAVIAVLAFVAAPAALAQSPEDIPGFEQLPIPGGDDPAEDPAEDPGDSPDDGPQVDAPGGGVDTGAGGMATAGSDGLALATAGALAVMGGAALVARRRAMRG